MSDPRRDVTSGAFDPERFFALMRSVGRHTEAKQFQDAARESIAFQLRTQIWPESAMHCRNPRRAIGANYRRALMTFGPGRFTNRGGGGRLFVRN